MRPACTTPDHAPHLPSSCHATAHRCCRPPDPDRGSCGTSPHPCTPSSASSATQRSPDRHRVDPTLLHLAGDNRATTGDREHILDRHQERLVHLADRLRDRRITGIHQLHDLGLPGLIALERLQRADTHHRSVITRELVLGQQLTNLQLDQLQQLLVVDRVGLVQRHHDVRHTHLASQQHVLTGLRHRTIRRRHHQDRTVDLRGAGDHVLDVVGMTRHVHMGIVAVRGLVLDMRDRDRDTTRLLLRRLIDLIERRVCGQPHPRQRLRDRSSQRGLAMVDMTHRANIDVRLVALKFRLAHCDLRLSGICGLSKNAGSVAARAPAAHLADATFFTLRSPIATWGPRSRPA